MTKKKFYKKWWFWLGIILIALAFHGNNVQKEEAAKKEAEEIRIKEEEEKEKEQALKQEEEKKKKQEEAEKKLQELQDEKLDLDWDKIIEATKKDITNPEFFNYVKDTYIKVDKDKKEIIFSAVLDDSISQDTAVEFADTFIRRFSSNASIQNKDIKGPENTYLGEVFDHYNIRIGIAPLSEAENSKNWYVFDAIYKGAHRNPKPN